MKTSLLILLLLLKSTSSYASSDITIDAPTPDLNKNDTPKNQYTIGLGSAFSLQKNFSQEQANLESSTTGLSLQIAQIRPLRPFVSTEIRLSYAKSNRDLKPKNMDFTQELYLLSLGIQFRFLSLEHSPYLSPKIGFGFSNLSNENQSFSQSSGFYGMSLGYELPKIWGLKIRLEKSYQFGLYEKLNGSRFEHSNISVLF
ncbi:MAG: hypothetical protein VX642_01930 [Bdellovibrionota bacterium]|nr:hypothetical protein [Bdellovibrionota bacterium]